MLLIWESHSDLSFEGSLHHLEPAAPFSDLTPPCIALSPSLYHISRPFQIKATAKKTKGS